MKVTAIVPAAGKGLRFLTKKGKRKPFFIIRKKPVLAHTLIALEGSGCIDEIIVVVHRDDVKRCRVLIQKYGLKSIKQVICGGKTRFDSVRKAFLCIGKDTDIVFIHDGVRPIITKEIISYSIRMCRKFGAVVCGIPAVSTIKFVNRDLTVRATPDRGSLYIIQTPQVFKKEIIQKAYFGKPAFKDSEQVTDDAMLVEKMGYRVKVIKGSFSNIKVTTPQDVIIAKALLGHRG